MSNEHIAEREETGNEHRSLDAEDITVAVSTDSAEDDKGVCCINGQPDYTLSKGECFVAGGVWKKDGQC